MRAKPRVLIIEDDPALIRGLKDNLLHDGYEVHGASDGETGLDLALGLRPGLILLDIMLPKLNGYELCRLLREKEVETPIIMLSAKGQEAEIVLGLRAGADDYVTKPFGLHELLARCEAALRRVRVTEDKGMDFGIFHLNLRAGTLLRDGQPVTLTPKERALLQHLARHPNRVLTRDQLLDAVWGYNVFIGTRSVDRCITTLRNKIEQDTRQPRYLKTVRDIGYRFDPDEM